MGVIIQKYQFLRERSKITSVYAALSKVLPAGPTKALLFFFF